VSDLRSRVEALLPFVRTPGQYVGREVNAVVKDPGATAVSFCLAFPETYELGMSHVGLKILYEALNRRDDVRAERCFAPWVDMAQAMRERGVPLWSLESFTPVREFDCVGFSLQYELLYTNVLAMLELAGIPVLSADRGDDDPVVIAGGPGAYNPEPTADFFDAFVIGDGEDAVVDIADVLARTKGALRIDRLAALAAVEGVYVPRFYEVSYHDDGRVASVTPNRDGVPERVSRRVVRDLDAAPYPVAPPVPFVETVHDRYAIEIMRGCVNACRFCQASVNYRPRRERSLERILELAKEGVKRTGFDEVGLLSLSSADYSSFGELAARLSAELGENGVSLSLPSLRIDSLLRDVPKAVRGPRKSGMTIAPECASDRLRAVIAKPLQNADLYAAVKSAYEEGWETVKLYFMVGLPGETDEDVRGIAEMANEVCHMRKRMGKSPAKVNLSISTFVPKAHTPFQWEAMTSRDEVLRRQDIVKKGLRGSRIKASFHDIETTMIEGVFSRGDRRLSKALLEARARGCVFDAWSEHFKPDVWREAFGVAGIDPDAYAARQRADDEVLPWSHIDGGATVAHLAKSRDAARAAACSDGE
jgi:radical SAM family uncharacterized protein